MFNDTEVSYMYVNYVYVCMFIAAIEYNKAVEYVRIYNQLIIVHFTYSLRFLGQMYNCWQEIPRNQV